MKKVGDDWENSLNTPNSSLSLSNCPKTHRCPNGLVFSSTEQELPSLRHPSHVIYPFGQSIPVFDAKPPPGLFFAKSAKENVLPPKTLLFPPNIEADLSATPLTDPASFESDEGEINY